MMEYASTARERGFTGYYSRRRGGAAHLIRGMVAFSYNAAGNWSRLSNQATLLMDGIRFYPFFKCRRVCRWLRWR